jgi:hypothetical protein
VILLPLITIAVNNHSVSSSKDRYFFGLLFLSKGRGFQGLSTELSTGGVLTGLIFSIKLILYVRVSIFGGGWNFEK